MAPNFVEKIADALHLPGSLKKPKFDKEKVTVIFVLGGPGAGASFPLLSAALAMKICPSWVRERNTVQPSRREV